jgi:AraC-like DNA-binding protein
MKVWFTHSAPDDISEYLRIFRAPVLFRQSVNALVLSPIDLSVPIRQADPELFSILKHQTDQYLTSLDRSTPYQSRVRRALPPMLEKGVPNLKLVSAKLNMGARTLQLKLQNEGTSFQRILDDEKKLLALDYLTDESTTIAEIAYQLGFSEPSAFNRAFRRWMGMSPGSYRKQQTRRTE